MGGILIVVSVALREWIKGQICGHWGLLRYLIFFFKEWIVWVCEVQLYNLTIFFFFPFSAALCTEKGKVPICWWQCFLICFLLSYRVFTPWRSLLFVVCFKILLLWCQLINVTYACVSFVCFELKLNWIIDVIMFHSCTVLTEYVLGLFS